MNLEIDTIRIFVTDIGRAATFYRDKLELRVAHDGLDDGYLVFESGGISLVLEAVDPHTAEADDLVGRFTGMSFRVDDVAEAYQDLLSRDVEFSGTPAHQAWGGTLAHFFDPDGNQLTLVSYE